MIVQVIYLVFLKHHLWANHTPAEVQHCSISKINNGSKSPRMKGWLWPSVQLFKNYREHCLILKRDTW